MLKFKFIFVLLIPFGIHAQSNRLFFIEAGTCFNTALNRNFHIKDPGGSTTSFEYKGIIQSMPSYYLKGGFEKQFNLCPKSFVSFPVSIGYFNAAQKIKAIGGWSGCTGSESGEFTFLRNNHTFGLSIGAKFASQLSKKISLQNGINFGPTILAYQEDNIKIVNENGTTGFYSGYGTFKIAISSSLQSGVFFDVNPTTKIGFTAEYFFFTKQFLPKDYYRFRDIYDFEFGHKGYSAMLNAGLRLQHSF